MPGIRNLRPGINKPRLSHNFPYLGQLTCVTLLDFLDNSLLLEISVLVPHALLNMRNGNLFYPVKIPWHQGSRLFSKRNVTIFSFSFDIEECKNCDCDKLTFSTSYGGITGSNPKCVRRTSRYQEARNVQEGDADPEDDEDGRDIWFRFVSDDTIFYKGFNLSYIVKSRTRKLFPFLSLFLAINNPENFKL